MTFNGEALVAVLETEHMVIYGYGVLGALLDQEGKTQARTAESAHRDRRDAVAGLLAASGLPVPAAAAAYRLAEPISDAAGAQRLAVSLEESAARAWRAALAATDGDDRAMVLEALTGCAVQAMRWRRTAGLAPVTVAFPGQ